MTIDADSTKPKMRIFLPFVLVAIVCATVSYRQAYAQTTAAPLATKGGTEPTKKEPQIKVTFDETAPGIIVVESAGERVRIDTMTKTVARIDEPAPSATEGAMAENKKEDAAKPEDDEADEPGTEPYDYRLINVPTPRSVPRHSLNMYFTHRFSQTIRPVRGSARNLLGLDSYAVSSFGLFYGITDKLYVSAYRSPLCQTGLCRTIEIGAGYQVSREKKGHSPVTMALYASVEGNDNFTEKYTFNVQGQFARSVSKYVTLFFAPALHFNTNKDRRFNPRPEDFFPREPLAAKVDLGRHTGSFGFGVNGHISRSMSLLFEFTPRVGFKLGRVDPIFDRNFNITGFKNVSYPEIGFGIEKDVGRHAFSLTFSNTQTTTTGRYNSSNLFLSPKNWVIGFNLFRRMW